jgi:phosphonatase-like hydrolase
MELQLAVFDMAGTTVVDRDGVNSCFRAALEEAGLRISATEVNAVMGLPKAEAVRRLIERSALRDQLIDQVEPIHRAFVARMIRFYETDPDLCEFPGTSETFEVLHKGGVKVALNTGFSRNIAQVIIDRLGWARNGLIDASIASDEVTHGRPHPDMIKNLMKRLGVDDPLRVAKIGDTPVDLEEGKNAGCGWLIGVTSGSHTREQLQNSPHTHLIDSVADLPRALGLVSFCSPEGAVENSQGRKPLD